MTLNKGVERVFQREIQEANERHDEQVVAAMLKNNELADKIVKYFGWPPERVMSFAKQIGVTTLTL